MNSHAKYEKKRPNFFPEESGSSLKTSFLLQQIPMIMLELLFRLTKVEWQLETQALRKNQTTVLTWKVSLKATTVTTQTPCLWVQSNSFKKSQKKIIPKRIHTEKEKDATYGSSERRRS